MTVLYGPEETAHRNAYQEQLQAWLESLTPEQRAEFERPRYRPDGGMDYGYRGMTPAGAPPMPQYTPYEGPERGTPAPPQGPLTPFDRSVLGRNITPQPGTTPIIDDSPPSWRPGDEWTRQDPSRDPRWMPPDTAPPRAPHMPPIIPSFREPLPPSPSDIRLHGTPPPGMPPPLLGGATPGGMSWDQMLGRAGSAGGGAGGMSVGGNTPAMTAASGPVGAPVPRANNIWEQYRSSFGRR